MYRLGDDTVKLQAGVCALGGTGGGEVGLEQNHGMENETVRAAGFREEH